MDSSEESLPPQLQPAQTSSPSLSGKIPFGLPERTSRHWDRKVKERVLLELDAGNSVGVLSNRYGIPRRTIRNWKSRGINNSYGSSGGGSRNVSINPLSSSPSPLAVAITPGILANKLKYNMTNGNSSSSINNNNNNNNNNNRLVDSNCVMTKDQEKMLYERIQRLSEFNQAAIKEDKLQEIAYNFLDEYGIDNNFEYGKVDAVWLDKFLYRNQNLGKLYTFISNEFYDLNNTNNDYNLEIVNNALLTIKSGGKINTVAKKFNLNEEILCNRLKKESLIKPLLSNQQEIKLVQKLNRCNFPATPNFIILTKSKIRAEIVSYLNAMNINYNHKNGYDWITEFVSQYYLQIYHQTNSNNSGNINNDNNSNNNNDNDNNSNSDDDEFRNSLNNIKDATEDIKSGIPIRIVAFKYNLPYQILKKWYAIETFLNKKHELYFVNSIKHMRLTKASIKNLLYEYCEKNCIPFQFTNQDDNTDHYDDDDDEFNYWYDNFIENYSYLNVVNERGSYNTTHTNNSNAKTANNENMIQFKKGTAFFNRNVRLNQSTPLKITAIHQNLLMANRHRNSDTHNTNTNDHDDDEDDVDDDDDDDDDENDNAKDANGHKNNNGERNVGTPSNSPSDDDGDEHDLQIDEDNDDDNNSSDQDDDPNNDDTTNNEAPSKNNIDGSQSNDFSAGGSGANYDDTTDIINELQNEANKDDDDIKFDYSLLNTDFYNGVTNYYENENDDLNAAKRKRWDNETKQKILECIKRGESVAALSDRYKVPRRTIQNWKSIFQEASEDYKKGVLKLEEEFDLISKFQVLKQNGAAITKPKFLEMVYMYCEEHNIKHPFRNGQAGRKWYRNFLKRHPQFTLNRKDLSLGDIPDDSFYDNDSIL